MQLKQWFKSGTPWIWMNAAAVSASLIMVFGLLGLIMVRGLGFFWPADVVEMQYMDRGEQVKLIGEVWGEEDVSRETLIDTGIELKSDDPFIARQTLKVGNRDVYGADFRLVIAPNVVQRSTPENVLVVVRREWVT